MDLSCFQTAAVSPHELDNFLYLLIRQLMQVQP